MGARGGITPGGLGATPQAGTTTVATSRNPGGSQTTPGTTTLAAIKDEEKLVSEQRAFDIRRNTHVLKYLPRGSQTTRGPTTLAAIKVDERFVTVTVLKL